MYPIFFHLPVLDTPIYSYGVMMVVAFLACQWLSGRLARRFGIDPDIFVNVTLVALVSGVIGARVSHILETWSHYTDPARSFGENLLEMVNIRNGGLTFYGGLIGASMPVLFYLLHKKVPARIAMDICAPCIVLGLGIGRVGCFLNGCCYGADTTLPWAVSYPYDSNAYKDEFYTDSAAGRLKTPPPPQLVDFVPPGKEVLKPLSAVEKDPRLMGLSKNYRSNPSHPAQLYSTVNSLLIMCVLLVYLGVPHTGGRVFALMLILEGPTRFILELLRVEPPVLGSMSLSMVIGLVLLVIGVILWVGLAYRRGELLVAGDLETTA